VSDIKAAGPLCECGRSIALPTTREISKRRELTCHCGRLYDLEFVADKWQVNGVLTPEGSVPVSGFSRELRARPDVRRFWFLHPISPAGHLIGHVVFSPYSREAEVKAADQKARRYEEVETATEAWRRWIEQRPSDTRKAGGSRGGKNPTRRSRG
jgi:hypothetical protein